MAGGRLYTPEEDALILDTYAAHNGKRGWVTAASKATGRQPSSIANRHMALTVRGARAADESPEVKEWLEKRAHRDPMAELAERFQPIHMPPLDPVGVTHEAGAYAIVSSDHHWPIHDERVESIILQAIERLRPRYYVLNGDGPDMLALSAFPKDARRGHSWELRDEQRHSKNWWWQVANRMQAWGGLLYETEANHSGNGTASRWRRWLNQNASALFGLDGFEEVMDYARFFHPEGAGVRMVDEVVIANDLRIRHGELVRKHGGYSARAHGDKWQSSVMHGHTHRIGSSIKRRPGIPGVRPDEFLRTYETGCVCKLDPDYCPGGDWAQGFAVISIDDRMQNYGVELVQVVDGMACSPTLGTMRA